MRVQVRGKVTGGVVLGSGAAWPSSIQAARFGSSPAATMGSITSNVAPSKAKTSTGRSAVALGWDSPASMRSEEVDKGFRMKAE